MNTDEYVLSLVSLIPRGKVITYGQLAAWAGIRSARYIGQILHRNKHPIVIPCHRILAKDGSLHGYGAGLDKKKELLESEGVKVDHGKVDLSIFGWSPPKA